MNHKSTLEETLTEEQLNFEILNKKISNEIKENFKKYNFSCNKSNNAYKPQISILVRQYSYGGQHTEGLDSENKFKLGKNQMLLNIQGIIMNNNFHFAQKKHEFDNSIKTYIGNNIRNNFKSNNVWWKFRNKIEDLKNKYFVINNTNYKNFIQEIIETTNNFLSENYKYEIANIDKNDYSNMKNYFKKNLKLVHNSGRKISGQKSLNHYKTKRKNERINYIISGLLNK